MDENTKVKVREEIIDTILAEWLAERAFKLDARDANIAQWLRPD